MQRSDFELMAPAGSLEAMMAAFQGGADAVYFGVGHLNMRAHSARSFTEDDLPELAKRCVDHGVKSFLTVNTVLYDEDLGAMRAVMEKAARAGISAVIVADVAAMLAARAVELEVHLSTQLNIANVEALRFYAQFADVAVLARELTLEQVAHIHQAVISEPILGPSGKPIRLEMFCHGALCMAVSGRCYLSEGTRGKSANRGECLQTCRREYIVKDKERDIELEVDNGYIFSPQDLKTIGFLDRMVSAGARVFKIEGRARGPEYVRTVTAAYNEALIAIAEGHWEEASCSAWDERLATVFNRGFWDGYYLGTPVAELTDGYGSKATERKVFTGQCLSYYSKAGVGYFRIQAGELKEGDKVIITGPTTGAVPVEVQGLRVNDQPGTVAKKGDEVTFKVSEKIRTHDKLYRMEKADR